MSLLRRRRRAATGHADGESGAAAVEFALVVPLLILLVFGIIQFGITFGQILALNNASRQGARVGVVNLNTCGTIMTQVQQGAASIGLEYPLAVTVTRGGSAVCTGSVPISGAATYSAGSASTVACPTGSVAQALTVTSTSTPSFSIPPFFFVDNFTVRGNGVYQCELS